MPHMSGIPGHDGHIPVIHINNLKILRSQTVLPTPPLNDPLIIILAILSPPLMLSFHNSMHSALPHILQ